MQKAIVLGLLLLCVSEVRAAVDGACDDDAGCTPTVETCDTTIPNGGSAGTCKLALDQDCSSATGKCVSGAECATVGSDQFCKLSLDSDCSSATDKCIALAECATVGSDKLCKLSLDNSCAANRDKCVPNAECDTGDLCKLSLDSDCSSATDKCIALAECATVGSDKLCKLGVGATCVAGSGNTGEKCATNSVCGDVGSSGSVTCECPSPFVTEDNLCKSAVGASCTSSSALCIKTATCEGTSCKIKHSQSCSGTGTAANCVANAQCVNSTCKCDGTENSDGTCNAAGSGVSVTASLILLLSTQLIFRLF